MHYTCITATGLRALTLICYLTTRAIFKEGKNQLKQYILGKLNPTNGNTCTSSYV